MQGNSALILFLIIAVIWLIAFRVISKANKEDNKNQSLDSNIEDINTKNSSATNADLTTNNTNKQDNPVVNNETCDNTCIEEGNDIFATKREEGKVAFRNEKRTSNNKRNNGKKYCRHCGAEILYDDNKCDWCGEDQ